MPSTNSEVGAPLRVGFCLEILPINAVSLVVQDQAKSCLRERELVHSCGAFVGAVEASLGQEPSVGAAIGRSLQHKALLSHLQEHTLRDRVEQDAAHALVWKPRGPHGSRLVNLIAQL